MFKALRQNKRRGGLFRALVLVLSAMMLLSLLGCGKKKKKDEAQALPSSSLPVATPKPTPQKTYKPQASKAPQASAEVTQVVARYFPDVDGLPTLYAAIEYKNTGDAPIVVSNVKVKFNTGAFVVDGEFVPMMADDDFIAPGQTSTLALWQTYEKEKDTLKADSAIKASAEIAFEGYDSARLDRRLSVSNLRLIKNYPAFATISGSMRNPSQDRDYALSLVYVSFYDDDEKLLGVWHFTKNLAIPAEGSRNFVMHLQSLPIPTLSEDAKVIRARALGID